MSAGDADRADGRGTERITASCAYGAERPARILVVACQSPAELGWSGRTHWSVRDLARYLGEHPEPGAGRPSESTLGKIPRAADIRPERL